MPYYTIPQRLQRLRAKSAAENVRRSRPHRQAVSHNPAPILQALIRERESINAQIALAEYRLNLLNDLIAMYEK